MIDNSNLSLDLRKEVIYFRCRNGFDVFAQLKMFQADDITKWTPNYCNFGFIARQCLNNRFQNKKSETKLKN